MSRAVVIVVSLAVLGGAGWASWTGIGAGPPRPPGEPSVRTGSPGVILLPGGGFRTGGGFRGGGTFGVK